MNDQNQEPEPQQVHVPDFNQFKYELMLSAEVLKTLSVLQDDGPPDAEEAAVRVLETCLDHIDAGLKIRDRRGPLERVLDHVLRPEIVESILSALQPRPLDPIPEVDPPVPFDAVRASELGVFAYPLMDDEGVLLRWVKFGDPDWEADRFRKFFDLLHPPT